MDDLELATNLITRVNVGDALTRTAARLPDQLAVVDGARSWTYRQLNERVNRVANALTARGYSRGDALALASGNSCEFAWTCSAAISTWRLARPR
jgi:long-chain acyl-CoA synthetase